MFLKFLYSICTSCRPKKSKTVTYAFPFVALALVLFGAAVTSDVTSSYLVVESSPQTVRAGEPFFITVDAVAHTPVNAVDIVLEYPESQINVTGIDTGQSVITLWAEKPSFKNGKVYLIGGVFRKGFLGRHRIARIRAEALESGSAYITTDEVRFIAGDGFGTEISVNDSEEGSTRIYIRNEDGSLVGVASVHIITDIDGDGSVGLSDISAFMAAWFNRHIIFDFNGDGKMTFRDFSILLADSFFK